MKKSRWLSSLMLIPLSVGLILSGCGTSSTAQQNQDVQNGPGPSKTQGSSTGTTDPTSSQKPPESTPQTPVDTAHNDYEGASIDFQSASNGFIGGQGFIIHTTDGGAHWAVQYQGPYQIVQLSIPNATDGFALGQMPQSNGPMQYALLSTTDGGYHWNVVSKPVPSITTDPHAPGPLHFVSATEGTLGNQVTADGGKTWQTLPVPKDSRFNPLFLDQTNGWLLYSPSDTDTQLRFQRTADGGKTWGDTLSKATQGAPNGGLLKATSPDDLWALVYGDSGMSQTSYSLFHTADGGKNWLTVLANSTAGGGPAPGVASATPDPSKQGPLTKPGDLAVVDSQTAYLSGSCPACGDLGTVTVGGTKDGGKTWTNFQQKFPGADGVLSFVTPTQGWLMVNTYQHASVLYETTDGGSSWKQEFVFGTNAPKQVNQ